jgi:hypothetical protein
MKTGRALLLMIKNREWEEVGYLGIGVGGLPYEAAARVLDNGFGAAEPELQLRGGVGCMVRVRRYG